MLVLQQNKFVGQFQSNLVVNSVETNVDHYFAEEQLPWKKILARPWCYITSYLLLPNVNITLVIKLALVTEGLKWNVLEILVDNICLRFSVVLQNVSAIGFPSCLLFLEMQIL